jgi:hypothetical protein
MQLLVLVQEFIASRILVPEGTNLAL